MNKMELINALVELNLKLVITDKQLVEFKHKLDNIFNSDAQAESQEVSENEAKEEICLHDEKHVKIKDGYYECAKCGYSIDE